MAERIFAIVGSALLVIGPARQAITDLRKAESLARVWRASELADVLKDALVWIARLSIGGSAQLLIPPLLIKRVREGIDISRRYVAALAAFASAANENKYTAALVAEEISKAINWGIVVVGSVFLFMATVVALVTYL
jgi:hypothetical protein